MQPESVLATRLQQETSPLTLVALESLFQKLFSKLAILKLDFNTPETSVI